MSTIVTQAEICATTVTQADYNISAASSAVSPTINDFRRTWITPSAENSVDAAERIIAHDHHDRSAKLAVNDVKTLSQQPQQHLLQHSQSQQQSIDYDDEVALHPLSNQARQI